MQIKNKMTIRIIILSFLIPTITFVYSQDFKVLIETCWKNDKMLQSKEFQLQQAEFAIKEARAQYFPQVNFGTSYNLAVGGRTIDFPVGDLLNKTYSTLNQLTQSNSFPIIMTSKGHTFFTTS